MVDVAVFRAGDADEIELQPAQVEQMAAIGDWRAILRAVEGSAWTVRIGGRVVAIAGLAPVWRGRVMAWAYIGAGIPRAAWPALHRLALRFLALAQDAGARRIEAEVRAGWAPGEWWARLLGFEHEGVAPSYFPDGGACSRWARVRA